MRTLLKTIVIATLVWTTQGVAHHSSNVDYHIDSFVTIKGEFVDFRWVNPHALLRINVTNANGEKEVWAAETHGSTVLARFGWRPDMFQAGQALTLYGNPSRKGQKAINMLTVTTADDKVYDVHGPGTQR